MPEGPEVETVRRTLEPSLVGRSVLSSWVGDKKLRNSLRTKDFRLLEGNKIVRLGRHGKLLWLDFSGELRTYVRLGMTGQLKLTQKDAVVEKHTHVRLILDGDGQELRYVDPRRFGEFSVTIQGDNANIEKMGPDPTSDWSREAQAEATNNIRKSSRSIKEILLDQAVLAGVGNIYASESLFLARISPVVSGNALSPTQIVRLLKKVHIVLQAAIENCGTSFSNYVDGNGKKGANIDFVQVFMRHGLPCPRCKNTIDRLNQGGRSTYYCAKCQSS